MKNALKTFKITHKGFLVVLLIASLLIYPSYMINRLFLSKEYIKGERDRIDLCLQTDSPIEIMRDIKSFEHMTSNNVAKSLRESNNVGKFGRLNYDCRRIALAYELYGNYDEELKWLRTPVSPGTPRPGDLHDFARIDFKKGDKEEAFRKYCAVPANQVRDAYGSDQLWFDRSILMKEIWFESYPPSIKHLERLSPFRDYAEFLAFINEEYEALGRPAEYAEAVEWYRAMAPAMSQSAPAEPTPDSGEAGEL